MTMRVNLIHYKLIFLKKNTKTKHTGKKKVHMNSAIHLHCLRAQCNSLAPHVNTEFCKAAINCFAKFPFKTLNFMVSTKIKLYF
jgi:hypothetical protein